MLNIIRQLIDYAAVRSGHAPRQSGATLIEYALIAALIAIAAVVVMGTVGGEIGNIFTDVETELTGADDE